MVCCVTDGGALQAAAAAQRCCTHHPFPLRCSTNHQAVAVWLAVAVHHVQCEQQSLFAWLSRCPAHAHGGFQHRFTSDDGLSMQMSERASVKMCRTFMVSCSSPCGTWFSPALDMTMIHVPNSQMSQSRGRCRLCCWLHAWSAAVSC